MGVVKEWHCGGCGLDFDSEVPACFRCGAAEPHVTRAFRTAPGFKGDKTKLLDTSLQNFTKHYSLSDFSNNPSTAHEKKYPGMDGQPITLNDTWKPANQVVSAPEPGESQADLVRSLVKTASEPIGSKKIVVGKERHAGAR